MASVEEDERGGAKEHPGGHEVGGRRAVERLEPRGDGEHEEADDARSAHLREKA